MNEPRVGQLVKISPSSNFYGTSNNNPAEVVGIIYELWGPHEVGFFIQVYWGSEYRHCRAKVGNNYRKEDLIYLT